MRSSAPSYCVANAIVRRGSALPHFRVEAVRDAAVGRLIERVTVEPDAALDARGHTAVDVLLHTDDGRTHARSLDIAPGFPDNPLSDAQQRARFDDCMAYAPRPLPRQVGRVPGRRRAPGRTGRRPRAGAAAGRLKARHSAAE